MKCMDSMCQVRLLSCPGKWTWTSAQQCSAAASGWNASGSVGRHGVKGVDLFSGRHGVKGVDLFSGRHGAPSQLPGNKTVPEDGHARSGHARLGTHQRESN
eukprot:1161948-Pelagomonas_calceolata.AAC.2